MLEDFTSLLAAALIGIPLAQNTALIAVVKSAPPALVNALISTVTALYLTVKLTLYTLFIYFNCTFIIPFTLYYLSILLTSLGIIGFFKFNNAIIAVD